MRKLTIHDTSIRNDKRTRNQSGNNAIKKSANGPWKSKIRSNDDIE